MSDTNPDLPDSDVNPHENPQAPVKLRQPPGLWCLFIVEMWERFSYYGMRAILLLYLLEPLLGQQGPESTLQPGRGWPTEAGGQAYGWYTGLCYLFPIFGGLIADRLIGTHRSMLVGAWLIMMGHITLAISGLGQLATNDVGMATFIAGLALIVLGTGHFKPCVSVMVGQLYQPHDPRRDGGFTIFYMGINVGAALCPFVVGTLGERVGWHWGFGAAAVGMALGLIVYTFSRPFYLKGIGLPPEGRSGNEAFFLFFGSLALAVLFGGFFFIGGHRAIGAGLNWLVETTGRWLVAIFSSQEAPPDVLILQVGRYTLAIIAVLVIIALSAWFVSIQQRGERGPVFTILSFIIFNAFFWMAFEQAGSSLTLFARDDTDRGFSMPAWIVRACTEEGSPVPWGWWIVLGVALALPVLWRLFMSPRHRPSRIWMKLLYWLLAVLSVLIIALGIHKAVHPITWLANFSEFPVSWFQSVNPLLIVLLAPLYSIMWGKLGKRNMNPTQSLKITYGLILLGCGYLVVTAGGGMSAGGVKVGMWILALTYLLHTMGELCLSPTGLSFVTKASPVKWVAFLMGLWFLSNFVANLGGGIVAGYIDQIGAGEMELFWYDWFRIGGRGDFFLMFVISSFAAALVALILTPLFKRLLHGVE